MCTHTHIHAFGFGIRKFTHKYKHILPHTHTNKQHTQIFAQNRTLHSYQKLPTIDTTQDPPPQKRQNFKFHSTQRMSNAVFFFFARKGEGSRLGGGFIISLISVFSSCNNSNTHVSSLNEAGNCERGG